MRAKGYALLLALLLTSLPVWAEEGWPRRFDNADGSVTEIVRQPARILSTSVTVSGTLLAMDAPVVASASAANGRFFTHWQAVAQARGVENVWPAASIDLEAAYAVQPDLIVVSASGADSALEQLAELRAIAPTIIVDYGGQDWQALATLLGRATGMERQAQARIESFDRYVAEVRGELRLPSGEVNIISFNGPGTNNPVATATGVHARLFSALGMHIESPAAAWHAGAGKPGDFVWAPYEHLLQLRAPTTFLLRGGEERVAAFLGDPMLANLPSVRSGQVYALGESSFRIDYYSARELVERIRERFGE
ncbi:Fe2+-enterobactin ABC transporter substrate-binding protein [Pseudomonas sp. ABC1]|uniref:Fe2+-enterobactin ABC transporter substrate-binding protein n=1 Tax=Pseudomonas sp. ABC1 TaxID=2748080 RepID=UPI0015C302BB|nr:Fe2+-enterobactin ABC transporter substrate-binding protein [Pseudomonas sp. ABC1]QLF94067.1 Fe2+-enterobactin ABC transporter substrate-binding protein [Pseudomonas sp. ABC1]